MVFIGINEPASTVTGQGRYGRQGKVYDLTPLVDRIISAKASRFRYPSILYYFLAMVLLNLVEIQRRK